MKKAITILTVSSYSLILLVLVLLGLAYRFHCAGNQMYFLVCVSAVFICFGVILTLQTKLKWNEHHQNEK